MSFKDDDDDDSKGFGVSRNIMLAAILSLLAVVTLIILLHIYGRHLLRRRERRNQEIIRRLRRLQVEPQVGDSSEPAPKQGLDPLVIASLPMFTYKPADGYDHGGESLECSVCLGNIVEDVMVRVLPNCKHMFHVECVDMWLESHTTCPICRTVAEPPVPSEESQHHSGVQPSAPPLEANILRGAVVQSEKVGGSGSRLGSFRWMLNRERSSRSQRCGEDDPERQ